MVARDGRGIALYSSRLVALRDVVVSAPGEISLVKLGAAELL